MKPFLEREERVMMASAGTCNQTARSSRAGRERCSPRAPLLALLPSPFGNQAGGGRGVGGGRGLRRERGGACCDDLCARRPLPRLIRIPERAHSSSFVLGAGGVPARRRQLSRGAAEGGREAGRAGPRRATSHPPYLLFSAAGLVHGGLCYPPC